MTETSTRPIQLLVVDDHSLFRRGLMALLSQDPRFEVCCEAGDVGEALRGITRQRPDVILLDNMGPDLLREAGTINREHHGLTVEAYPSDVRRTVLEASGNVNIQTIRAIAETGVDYISTSKITMAAPTLDIGLDIVVS